MQKRWKLNKRGYFFLIDSVLALSVLAVGTFLIFTFYAQQLKQPAYVIIHKTYRFFQ